MLDVTLMSLYWVARLPTERTKGKASDLESLPAQASQLVRDRENCTGSQWQDLDKRQRKIALSLAILSGAAAPFVLGLFQSYYTHLVWLFGEKRAGTEIVFEVSAGFAAIILASVGIFVCVFVLAFIVPAAIRGSVLVVRRYWRWLNT